MSFSACLSSVHQLPTSVQGLLSRGIGGSTALRNVRIGAKAGFGENQQRRGIAIEQLDKERNNRERVVILGSGWAGFTVAKQLDSKKYQAVVVSPRSYFAFTPLLASTAVGTLEFRTALEPVRNRQNKVHFFQGWADDADFKNKTITIEQSIADPSQSMALTTDRYVKQTKDQDDQKMQTEKGKTFDIKYDKLIVSVGCYSQTFGTPGVKEHAYFLKDVGDARKIRNRLLQCFETAALPTTSDAMRKQLLNFAVVGGGPTGIEFSGELHDLIHEDLAKIYPELIKFHKITVYDVAEKVLPMFDEKLASWAMKKFNREGINIKTKHHVEALLPGVPAGSTTEQDEFAPYTVEVKKKLYTLKVKEEGEIGVGMCVWSTGLMQNPFIRNALDGVRAVPDNLKLINSPDTADVQTGKWKVKKDARTGSIITDSSLRIKLTSTTSDSEAVLHDVYALGDCGIIQGTHYPATAQVAAQKAKWLSKHFNRGDLDKTEFTYKDMGTMAYIGDWNALFQGGSGGRLQGYLAWIMWRGAYVTMTLSWRNKMLIPIYWMINWLCGRDISRF